MENLLKKLIVPVIILVALALVPYLIGPFMIRRKVTQSAKPQVENFPINDPNLPKKVAGFFRKVLEALKPLGFEAVAGMTLPKQTPNVTAIVLMLANRADKVAALASAMYAIEEKTPKLKTAYVEFVSWYRDGTVVQTNNTTTLGAFPPREGYTTSRLPMVRDADRLYRLHQALEERHASSKGKALRLDTEFKGNAAAHLARSMVEELEAQVETGYFSLEEDEELFRPTLKGAFIMTWGQLWPFKSLREAKRDREARRLIRELEE